MLVAQVQTSGFAGLFGCGVLGCAGVHNLDGHFCKALTAINHPPGSVVLGYGNCQAILVGQLQAGTCNMSKGFIPSEIPFQANGHKTYL